MEHCDFHNDAASQYGHDREICRVPQRVDQRHLRLKWSGCFSNAITAEIEAKLWCHTTAIPGFKEVVEGNKLVEAYD